MKLNPPPRLNNDAGEERRIGVELEFAAVSARDAAGLVRAMFGGTLSEEDAHRWHVDGSRLGDFVCELDTQYAHAPKGSRREATRDAFDEFLDEVERDVRKLYGDVSSLIVPCEVVCPPVPLSRLPEIDDLVEALVGAGAEGTGEHPLHAFGAQLNPEIATRDPEWLTAMLKAWMLCSDWIRAIVAVDATRRLTSFADPFPVAYMRKVVSPGYAPDLERLMDDYLAANPTRNRELDMLPLFAWLDEERVEKGAPGQKVSKRPTFHYRLPNADLGRPGWGPVLEWNRWQVVERLADDRDRLEAMGRDWLRSGTKPGSGDWALKASEWLLLG